MKRFLVLIACLGSALADSHPRLLFPPSREGDVKRRIDADPLARDLQAHVLKRAEKVLAERTCEYRIPDGKRLLSESRLALHNVLHCGWAWRTTGEVRFKDRVVRELDAACSLKDWNPSHFLDTAEMATAVAIGYDWLFPALSDEQKKLYQDALLEKALRVVGAKHANSGWWRGATNNWTQVCGTGMALAAEVVKEREPELCAGLIRHGGGLIAKCERFYRPDGAYPEGPSYWHYGTNYHVLLLAAADLEVPEVLRRSGNFMRHVTGPSRVSFNYADGNAYAEVPSPAQSWIATHSGEVEQVLHVRSMLERALKGGVGNGTTGDLRFFPLHLLWLPQAPNPGEAGRGDLGARFSGEQSFAFLRTGWTPDAAWLAIKGGTGAASHGHLDAGSFVYEAKGIRWFHDLGKDDYNLPGYFGKQRWDYLRLNNLSHNTLVIDGKLQTAPREGCVVSEVFSGNSKLGVVVKLAPAYEGQAQAVDRSFTFGLTDESVRTFDIVTGPVGPVRWAVVTKATPKFEGSRVVLEEAGKRLVLERHDQAGGQWEEYPLKPKTEREQQNSGFHLIGFTAPAAGELKLEVSWRPE